MTNNTEPLFTSEQEGKIVKAITEIYNSKFVDPNNPPPRRELMESLIKGSGEWEKHYKPGAYDHSNPEVMYREYWHDYLSQALIHGQMKTKSGKSRYDTTKERSRAAKQVAKHLGRTPTCADLKAAFPNVTQLDEELCQVMDRDLNNLS